MGKLPQPGIAGVLPFSSTTFMYIVGIIEIIAGVLVFWRPRLGGYVVMGWLIAIALTLIIGGHYFDVAVRDLAMAIGAFSLAKLSGAVAPSYSTNVNSQTEKNKLKKPSEIIPKVKSL